jgi:hypothetical protein
MTGAKDMSAPGRKRLYAAPGCEVPLRSAKQPFNRGEFQWLELPLTASCGPSSTSLRDLRNMYHDLHTFFTYD